MTVQTIQVSTAAQLQSVLTAATGGETIQLAAGNYGGVYLTQFNFAQTVTIQGGTFASLQVVSSSGLNFEGTNVNFVPDMSSTSNSQGIRVYQCQNVNFNNATLVGGPSVNGVDPSSTTGDATGNVLGLPVGKGINFDTCVNSSITNSDISMFAKGVTVAGGHDLLIDNNDIHDLRTTPISGSVISNLVITNNHTWDSHTWNFGGSGDHGDRIHIWTDKNAISGLVISNNYLDQGAGDPMLGIYLDDNGQKLGFTNAIISGNTLIDGSGQGVLLENVTGTVSDNTLIWSGYGTEANNTPRFDVNAASDHINFTNNIGNVSIDATSNYLNFYGQQGTIVEDAAMTSANRDTIFMDFQVITAHTSYTLNATTSDLYFVGTSGNFVGTGNALANHIVGGAGNDTLTGNGGADFLEGKAGNDTYVVDNAGQTIYDSGGTDLVKSSISWTLQTGLENLTYTGSGGATLAGNSAPNTITGGAGDDILIGNGGADKLIGGLGNDTYVIDNITQTVTDTGGIDTIVAGLNWTLQTGIENLTLTGAAVFGTGNTSANILTGNANDNTLDGKTGADTMYGGAGNDTYIVDNVGDQAIEIVGGVDSGGYDTVNTALSSWTLANGIEALTHTSTSAFTGTGNALANTLTGNGGVDKLLGLGGDDMLIGNAGNDILNGGAGVDILNGGTGNDTFVFARGEANGDSIFDFNGRGTTAGDVIELRGWGTGTTFTNLVANYWVIHDGLDAHEEYVIAAGVDKSDVIFTQIVTSTADFSATFADSADASGGGAFAMSGALGASGADGLSALAASLIALDASGLNLVQVGSIEVDQVSDFGGAGALAGLFDASGADSIDVSALVDSADAVAFDGTGFGLDSAAFESGDIGGLAPIDQGFDLGGAGVSFASSLAMLPIQHVV